MDEAHGLNNELDRKRNRLSSLALFPSDHHRSEGSAQLVADCVDKVPLVVSAWTAVIAAARIIYMTVLLQTGIYLIRVFAYVAARIRKPHTALEELLYLWG